MGLDGITWDTLELMKGVKTLWHRQEQRYVLENVSYSQPFNQNITGSAFQHKISEKVRLLHTICISC